MMEKLSEISFVGAVNTFDADWPTLSLMPFVESTVHRSARQCQLRIRAMLGAAHSPAFILPSRT